MREFSRFKSDSNKPSLPEEYGIEYLIFSLSEGDITRAETVANGYTYGEAVRWQLFRMYDAFTPKS